VSKWSANGKLVKNIAEISGITAHTVRHYLEFARFRLTALNNSSAIARALALHLIPPPD
jgi:DNA-binding CsgD family transcriptional regulator